jgi:hypothetical protein
MLPDGLLSFRVLLFFRGLPGAKRPAPPAFNFSAIHISVGVFALAAQNRCLHTLGAPHFDRLLQRSHVCLTCIPSGIIVAIDEADSTISDVESVSITKGGNSGEVIEFGLRDGPGWGCPTTSLREVCCRGDRHLRESDALQSTGKSLSAARSISR